MGKQEGEMNKNLGQQSSRESVWELIRRLCPDGVEYKRLGEVCDFERGSSLVSKDAVEGDVPVISGGQKPAFYHNVANRKGETITVAGSGAYAGYVAYWDRPIFAADCFTVKSKTTGGEVIF